MTQKGVAAMKIRPALDEVKTIAAAGGYKVLPVSGEILSDICTLVGELDPAKTTVQELGLYMAGARKQGKGE